MSEPNPLIHETVLLQSTHLRVTEFVLPTRHRLIPEIRSRLLEGIHEFQLATSPVENHFCMALEEALANAFFHGNLELCSSLKEECTTSFMKLAEEREAQQPWCDRKISVCQIVGSPGLWVTIRDEGRGFNVAAAMERCANPESLLCSGRGLLMMHAFTDELFFSNVGNEVTLVLYSRSADRELPVATLQSSIREPRFLFQQDSLLQFPINSFEGAFRIIRNGPPELQVEWFAESRECAEFRIACGSTWLIRLPLAVSIVIMLRG